MRFRTLAVAVLLLLAGLAAWRFWPGEERKVRGRLEALAAQLSIPPGEQGLARVTRAVGLRAFFAEDVTIELPGSAGGEGLGQTIRGREEIAGLVTRMAVPPEGTRVQILKMDTELAPGSDAANVRVDTRVVARQPKDAPPILDARMIALTLRKVDGAWLIASARVMPTDDSLGVR